MSEVSVCFLVIMGTHNITTKLKEERIIEDKQQIFVFLEAPCELFLNDHVDADDSFTSRKETMTLIKPHVS